jgi:hypothetical protein
MIDKSSVADPEEGQDELLVLSEGFSVVLTVLMSFGPQKPQTPRLDEP